MKYSLRSLMPKRRWFQFSLKTLLLAVVVMAAALSWYGYRLRIIEKERIRLAGPWYAEVDSVTVATFDADKDGIDLLMPSNGIGRINFQMRGPHGGLSLGIYRCDGEKMTVAQAKPGQPRPTSFEEVRGVSIWTGVRKVSPESQFLIDTAKGQQLMRDRNGNWTVIWSASQTPAPNPPKP
jgi:hypothetical protein